MSSHQNQRRPLRLARSARKTILLLPSALAPGFAEHWQERRRRFLSWPTLEDAHSIQFALRQVSLQLLDGAIDAKKAGLLFYALQIASSNLKRMKDETPQPEQVVVDPPELSEIPRPAPTPEAVRLNSHTTRLAHLPESPSENDEYRDDIKRQARELREELAFQIAEFEGHGNEGQSQSEAPETSKPGGGLHPNDGLPDGTIQACIGERQYVN